MRVAALDLGTNTFLLLVAEVKSGKILQVVHDEVRIVRLGEGVNQNRAFSAGALARANDCLRDYGKIARDLGVDKIQAVATSAARDVKNGKELFEIGTRWGIPIEVISGTREAEMTYAGFASGLDNMDGVVGVDIGGGSTEIVQKTSAGVEGESFDVGCVRLSEMFITKNPIPREERERMEAHARRVLSQHKGSRARQVIAVAGTPTTLAGLAQNIGFEPDKIDGYKLDVKTIRDWEERLAGMTIEERIQLKSLERGRADVIVPGAILLRLCAEILGVQQVTVSIRGIRYGLAMDMGK